jgi:predicted  nucleic acid-binding Zn-ribbon protein
MTQSLVRETAEADAPAGRMLTEAEAYAVAAAEVKRECASRDTEIDKLKADNAALHKDLDEALVRETALKSDVETAQKSLEDYKLEVETAKLNVERRESRLVALREAASGMPDTFFTEQARLDRVAQMTDEEFAAYTADIKAALGGKSVTSSDPPRETAMSTVSGKPESSKKLALSEFLGV